MRWRGVSHVEFSVREYDDSIAFDDALFGWARIPQLDDLMGLPRSAPRPPACFSSSTDSCEVGTMRQLRAPISGDADRGDGPGGFSGSHRAGQRPAPAAPRYPGDDAVVFAAGADPHGTLESGSGVPPEGPVPSRRRPLTDVGGGQAGVG